MRTTMRLRSRALTSGGTSCLAIALAATILAAPVRAPSPKPGYRIIYTQRELLDHDYILQWWQHVNDLFHRTATLRLPEDRTVRVDVTYQGYEYHRALEAMEGYEARRAPEEVAHSFRRHFRADRLEFSIAAYLEDAGDEALDVPLLKRIWMVVDGRRVMPRSLRVTSRGKLGQSLCVEAQFAPLAGTPREPWVALAVAGGGDAPATGQVLFPVDLVELPAMARLPGVSSPRAAAPQAASAADRAQEESLSVRRPVAGAAGEDSGASGAAAPDDEGDGASAGGSDEVAILPARPRSPAVRRRSAQPVQASLEPDPKYTYQERHDREYIDAWWTRVRDRNRVHYGSISTVGAGALLDVAFESRDFVRTLCAWEGFEQRQSTADIVDSYRRRYRSGQMRFLVRITNVLWPARTFYLKPMIDDVRVSIDGRAEYAPIRVEPADADVLKRGLTVEVVFRQPARRPSRDVVLTFRNLPTVDQEAHLRFPASLFDDRR